MARMARRISDKRMLKLVRAFLTAGVMDKNRIRVQTASDESANDDEVQVHQGHRL